MQRLILVRHGLTEDNKAGTIPGAGGTEALAPEGVAQLEKAAVALRGYLPAHLYASPMERAQQSARIVAAELGLEVETVAGIEERDWGELTGTSWAALQERLGTMATEERYTFVPPGGESWQQCEARIVAAIKKLLERHPDGTVIVVTHGGVIRALMPFLLRSSLEEGVSRNFDNGSITVFAGQSAGELEPVTINGTSHLKP